MILLENLWIAIKIFWAFLILLLLMFMLGSLVAAIISSLFDAFDKTDE